MKLDHLEIKIIIHALEDAIKTANREEFEAYKNIMEKLKNSLLLK